MIHLITALKAEANAFCNALSLKKRKWEERLNIYENDTVALLLTGSGKLAAATAITEYLSKNSFTNQDVFCNVGICGSLKKEDIGTGFLCVSVTDHATGQSVYPELFSNPFKNGALFTMDKPFTQNSSEKPSFGQNDLNELSPFLPTTLFDMEGYGAAFSLARKAAPSKMFFYKVVSDCCDGQFPSPEEVTRLLSHHVAPLLSFLSGEALVKSSKETDFHESYEKVFRKASEMFPFTASMQVMLRKLLSFASSLSFPPDRLIALLSEVPQNSTKKKDAAIAYLRDCKRILTEESVLPPLSSVKKRLLTPSSFVYVEQEVMNHPVTAAFLKQRKNPVVIPIRHYKDIFNRGKQDLSREECSPSFLLAANHGTKLYKGAPVCQSFGEEHFFYTSCIMNCLYDCDYCYLQGMYPSGHIVIFVNLEDYFKEIERELLLHPIYLCCSYDSDLTAFHGMLPHAEAFCRFAAAHPSLRLELRTKCASLPFLHSIPPVKNIVIAYTLSPEEIITRYEHFTSSLTSRLNAAKEASALKFSLRLCIDPILLVPNAKELYMQLVDRIFEVLEPEEITDISLGVFRISKDYEKQLRLAKPDCPLTTYPFEQTNGVCHYEASAAGEILTELTNRLLLKGMKPEQLFVWKP